jgi:hypothetical protein
MSTELKPMSAAEYRANAEKARANRDSETVQLTSGSVFQLRRPDLYSYMITGRLPQSLVSVGLTAWKKGTGQAVKDLKDEEAADMFVFMREIVHDCTVNPKFVEFAVNDNEISARDMLIEDFNEIFEWAMAHQGVAGLAGLQSFLPRRERGTATAGDDGAEQRSEGEQPLEAGGTVQ